MLTWLELIQFAEAQGVTANDEVAEIILNEKDTADSLSVYRDHAGRVQIW